MAAHVTFTPTSPDLHRKQGFNLRVSKYIWFSTTKFMKEKNGPKNLYLYSSQLYRNLKNKFALTGSLGGVLKGNVTYCKWLLEL